MHFVTQKFSLLLMLLATAGYSFPTVAQTDAPIIASIRKTGEVRVAITSLPPYMTVSPSGEATGPNIDLQNMVLKRMGLPPLTAMHMQWDAMIPGILAHQFDYIGAYLAITEARCEVLVFSAPTYASQAGLFVLPGNPRHLMGVTQLAHSPDIKVAVVTGSAQEAYVLKQGVKPEQLVRVPDVQAGSATVIGGRVNVFIVSQFGVPNPEQKGLELVVDEQSPVDGFAIAFRKEDVRFRDAFNEQLRPLLRNGTIQKLYEKYEGPSGDRVAQLIAKFTKAGDLVPSCE